METKDTQTGDAKPTQLKRLTPSDIYAAQDVTTQDVEVPEWGGVVTIKVLTAAEVAKYVEDGKKPGASDMTSAARAVAMSCVDERGFRIFSDEDVNRLQSKSFRAIIRIQEAVLTLNGLNKEDKQEAKKA